MANFHVTGNAELNRMFKDLAEIPDEVKIDILKAMGDKTKEAQAKAADEAGIRDSGQTIASLKRGAPRVTADGGNVKITFAGKRTDEHHKTPTRNAEIAFINEFGKTGQKARPFVKTAIEKNADKIAAAGEAVYRKWQESKT